MKVKHYEIIDRSTKKIIKIVKKASSYLKYVESNNYNKNISYNIIFDNGEILNSENICYIK